MMFSRIFFRLMNALIGILLARYLGVEQFGQYATVIAFVNLFMVFNDLGFSRYSLLEGSRDKQQLGSLLGNGLIVEAVMSVVVYVAMSVIIHTLGYSAIVLELFVILAIAELLFESRKIYQSTLQSLTKFHLISWQQIIYSLLFFVLVLGAVFYRPEVKLVAYIQLLVSALMFLIYLVFVFRYIRPIYKIGQIPGLLKKSWIFCVSSVFFIIYFQIATVLLSIMKTEADVGLYSAVYRLIVALYMIPQIIFQVALPYIYKFSLENTDKFHRITHTIQKYLLALAVPTTIVFWLGAEPIIRLVYGREYLPATVVMQIIAFVILIRFFTYASAESITAINRQKIRAIIEGVTALLNVSLNLILIPRYSYTGSAVATLASEFVLGILFYIYIEKYFRRGFLHGLSYAIPALLSGVFSGLLFKLMLGHLQIVIAAALCFIAYFVCLYLFKFLTDYDRKIIKEMLPFLNRNKPADQ